VSVLE